MITKPNYQFYQTGGKIIAVSSFAGRRVSGTAKCHPNDTYDYEYGTQLASMRCAEKIARKRLNRARSKVDEARAQFQAVSAHLAKMEQYERDAVDEFNSVSFELAQLLAQSADIEA